MLSINFKIELFFLFSLLAWFLVGYNNFLNFILIIQLISIFFFLNLKINYLKLIIGLLLNIFLLAYSENIDAFKIYFIFIVIILSFDYEKKIKTNLNIKEISIFLIFFLILFFYKMHPHVSNYQVKYQLKEDVIILDKIDGIVEKKTYKKNFKIPGKTYITECPALCQNIKKICDKKICSVSYNYFENRFTINKVDVNFLSIILLTLIFLAICNHQDKKNLLLILYLILGIFILFITKSRAGLIFFIVSIVIFYFKNFGNKKIIFLFLFSQIFLIFIGYLVVNSVEDPMRMFTPTISNDGLIKFPKVHEGEGAPSVLFRLFTIFDHSNFIRFSTYFQSYLILVNEFPNILFPDHSKLISDISYTTNNGSNFIVTKDSYHPHNLFMSIIKEAGLLYCIYFFYLIFSLFKHYYFKIIFTAMIFGSMFLGIAVIYLFPTILIFCFKTENNILKIKRKFKL